MSRFLLVCLLALSPFMTSSRADPLGEPCAPTVPAHPSHLSCRDADRGYSITIQTWMSPPTPDCQGTAHQEIHTASVSIKNRNTGGVSVLSLPVSSFKYRLALPGIPNGSFDNDEFNLHLGGCVSPAVGGMSGSN